MPGVPYLVHFPDGTDAVVDVRLPRIATPGTQLFSGWVVDRIAPSTGPHADDPAYEVWVSETADFVAHAAEVFRREGTVTNELLLDSLGMRKPDGTDR